LRLSACGQCREFGRIQAVGPQGRRQTFAQYRLAIADRPRGDAKDAALV
jgi:hypothetical protein